MGDSEEYCPVLYLRRLINYIAYYESEESIDSSQTKLLAETILEMHIGQPDSNPKTVSATEIN